MNQAIPPSLVQRIFPQNALKPAKSLRPSAYENMDLPRTPNGPSAYLGRTLRVLTQDLPRTA